MRHAGEDTILLGQDDATWVLAKKATTVVSTKGQVTLKVVRESKGWGKELIVEEARDGVLLWAARPLAPSRRAEVFVSLSHHGKRLTDEDIEKALRAAAKRRYAHD